MIWSEPFSLVHDNTAWVFFHETAVRNLWFFVIGSLQHEGCGAGPLPPDQRYWQPHRYRSRGPSLRRLLQSGEILRQKKSRHSLARVNFVSSLFECRRNKRAGHISFQEEEYKNLVTRHFANFFNELPKTSVLTRAKKSPSSHLFLNYSHSSASFFSGP